ncbi:MAG: hypothetical protein SFU99_19295 [Saprospiraceae bacterium]|nr:hypothetical protein [Saprospiraceae bacterium]
MKRLQIFILSMLLTAALFAQEQIQEPSKERSFPSFQLNGNFQVGIPLNDFRDNLDDIGFGAGVLFLTHLGDSPLAAGIELSLMGYASESAEYIMRVGGFVKEYELRTSSNIFLGHAVVRFQPAVNAFIRPYFDGMIGFKNLFTSSTLTDLDNSEATESNTDESDWALSYGGAFGLQVHFSKTSNIVLDLRCAYLQGQNASYLVRKQDPFGGFEYENPIDAFEEKTSATTLLLPQIGVTFKGLFNRTLQEETPPDND